MSALRDLEASMGKKLEEGSDRLGNLSSVGTSFSVSCLSAAVAKAAACASA